MVTHKTLELLTTAEAARRIGACDMTLRRRIARNAVLPDALLVEGSTKLKSPLFVASRLKELAALLDTTPKSKL